MKFLLITTIAAALLTACGGTASTNQTNAPSSANAAPAAPASNTPAPATGTSPSIPKDGKYVGQGKVTKINAANGSIEVDHKDIPGLMPAMVMEFNVADKKLLDGIKVGDEVSFIVLYKHPTETIISIAKAER